MATTRSTSIEPAAVQLGGSVLARALERTGSVTKLAESLGEDRGNTSKRLRGHMDMSVSQLAVAARVAGVELQVHALPDAGGPAVAASTAEERERARYLAALVACDNNRTKAAQRLGVSRGKLLHKLRGWGLLHPRN